jgi:nucleoside-diphosphate-sugar epimerase
MSLHVIVGAGTIGSLAARILADRGDRVRLVSRRGGGPSGAGSGPASRGARAQPAPDGSRIERVALDATDAAALREVTAGAAALYNCANPLYHRWPADWPPLAAAMLAAAEATGAVLVTTSNLYGYGPVDGAMTEDLPLRAGTVKGRVRARMWHDALAAHRAGRARVTEARASDYLGAGARSLVGDMVLPRVVAGRRASVPAALDVPHSFTYVGDVARTLVTLAGDERAWGAAWHVPTAQPVTIREVAERAAALAGAPAPGLSRIPGPVLWLGGLFSPLAREFREMRYQFERPFVLDSTAVTETFGLKPTPIDDAIAETVAALR